ncbi:MAG: energy-coupling factor transporter transmembrane protein EcfT [Eggerthellaceae bacterium]|jgi:energy-coupling factor transport system permease protein|nr:energy-coupling factor transporter transmembrane protein EcfT [Eggerthellaceae bacterium]
MQMNFDTYLHGTSLLHTGDARVKLALLLAYSITLFLVHTWTGILICAALCLAACIVAKIAPKRLMTLMIPLYVILAFTIIFNGFRFDVSQMGTLYGLGNVSTGVFEGWEPVSLIGSFGFVPEGLVRGCYYALRIILLVVASLVVSFTTTSTELIDALYDYLKPLRAFRVPVEDIAMMISVALRFIPLTAEELFRVQAAQQSRGAVFSEGELVKRIAAWQPVLIPMFVGLFRRADNLALAMESRCYAMTPTRTRLNPRRFSATSGAALIGGIILCVAIAVLL